MNLMMTRKRRHDLDFADSVIRVYNFRQDSVASDDDHGHIVDELSYTRASETHMRDAQGNYHSFPANDAAQTNLGLKISPAVTNHVVSSGMHGAVVGILGAGGSLPNGWLSSFAAYYTIDIISIGNEYGLPYMEIHFSGTNSSGSDDYQTIDANSNIPTNIGEIWTNSVFYKKTGGSWPVDPRLGLVSVTGSDGSSHPLFERTGDMDGLTRLKDTFTIVKVNPVTMRMRPIYFKIDNGETVDVTFRIYAPQLELGGYDNDPVITEAGVTGTSAATIAYDDVSEFDLSEGGLYLEFEYLNKYSQPPHNNDYGRFFGLTNGVDSFELYTSPPGSGDGAKLLTDFGVTTETVAYNIPIGHHKVMVVWSLTGMKLFLNGVLVASAALPNSFTSTDFEKLYIGSDKNGTRQQTVVYKKVVIYDAPPSDNLSVELTS